ncbi:adipogenin [Rhineura floridana]|uniref:adipogenin n=1 Tax=Rhineura floridana TaxID=261503 RepID=UPI002AC81E20|nr:adipogenin [Rhineura floridana]
MKYPLVPLINDLTFPLLFFWFCLPFGILLILLVFWLQHLLNDEAQVPIIREIKMPPSDNSDGNADLQLENESRGDNNQCKMPRKASKSAMTTTPPMKKMGPKPAYLSSKETSQRKSLSAFISDRLDQGVKQYCSEKSSLFNTVMLLSALLISLLFSLLCQLLEVSNGLRIQMLPSSLAIRVYQLFAWLNEMPVKIMISLKREICARSAFLIEREKKL